MTDSKFNCFRPNRKQSVFKLRNGDVIQFLIVKFGESSKKKQATNARITTFGDAPFAHYLKIHFLMASQKTLCLLITILWGIFCIKERTLKGTASKRKNPPFLFHILIVDLMPGSGIISITLGIESFPP